MNIIYIFFVSSILNTTFSLFVNIEFKILKNESDLKLHEIIKKYTSFNDSNNLIISWNKSIDIEELNLENETKERRLIKELIQLTPLKNVIEKFPKKSSTNAQNTSRQIFITKKNYSILTTIKPTGHQINKFFSSTFATINKTDLNHSQHNFLTTNIPKMSTITLYSRNFFSELINSTNFNNTNQTLNKASLSTILKKNKTDSLSFTKIYDSITTNSHLNENSTDVFIKTRIQETSKRLAENVTIFLIRNTTMYTTTNTSMNVETSHLNQSKTTLIQTIMINEEMNAVQQKNLTCKENFCMNNGKCYVISYLESQELVCKCQSYELIYNELLINRYSGKRCEIVLLSFTYLGLLTLSVTSMIIIILIVFLICTSLKYKSNKEKSIESFFSYEVNNPSFQKENNQIIYENKNSKSDKDSWKYLSLKKRNNKDIIFKRKNFFYNRNSLKKKDRILKKKQITLQRYLVRQTNNIFRSLEGFMSAVSAYDQNCYDSNFMIVRRNLIRSKSDLFNNRPRYLSETISLSLNRLDELCSSNVCIYPKPSRNSEDFRFQNNDLTMMNGSQYY